jgi:hypothetical protein
VINPRNSHSPLPDDRRRRCPVCRQSVYSKAGIHPQCAIKQADPLQPTDDPDALAEGVEAAEPVAAAKVPPKPKFKAAPKFKAKVKAEA